MSLKNKKILITGGAGFIGSNLCEFLLKQGSKVICLDNLSTGNVKNIESFLNHRNFKFTNGDIRNLNDCIESAKNVDYILHQAALGSVPRSIEDPVTSSEVNIIGFLNMLIAAKENKVKRFVYAASSSTYGDSLDLPKKENNIGKPLSIYAITKYTNEMYSDVFSKIFGLETIGLRYFNVYGKRQDPNGSYAAVIPKFVKQLINGENPTINGDGTNSRDFTYIDDVVNANILSLLTTNKEAINNVYNIAYGEKNSLNDLAKYLKKYLSIYRKSIDKIEIIYGPEREGDIAHSLACIEKAKNKLNYIPKFSLDKGLKKAIGWYWQNLT